MWQRKTTMTNYNWNQMRPDDPVDSYKRIHAVNKPDSNMDKILGRLDDQQDQHYSKTAGGVEKLELEFLNVKKVIRPYRKHLFVGKSGSGKTTKAVEVLRQMRSELNEVYVFTGSIEGKMFWGKYVPSLYIFCGYDPEKFRRIMENQAEMVDKYKRGEIKKPYRILVIFEDLSFLGSLMTKDNYVMMFIYQGRHLFIDGFIIAQYCKDFGPRIRGNMHYIYCTFIKERDLRQKIYQEWGGLLKNVSDFEVLLEKYTQNHCVLVIDTEVQSTDIRQNYYWFTVSPEQLKAIDEGFEVGNRNYRFNAALALERQSRIIAECGVSEETLRKWKLQKDIEQTINMNKLNPSGFKKGARGKK